MDASGPTSQDAAAGRAPWRRSLARTLLGIAAGAVLGLTFTFVSRTFGST